MKIKKIFKEGNSTEEIAQNLLGKLLVHETIKGRISGFIVETEAYLGVPDLAAHSYGGKRTKRTEAMFQKQGTLYVHVMHTHVLLNISTQAEGTPEGVLIRAIEPYEGISYMESQRAKHGFHLTNGPGNLTKALGITMEQYGDSIFGETLYLDEHTIRIPKEITGTPRIGIANKGIWTEKPLRFIVSGNPYVSRRKHKISPDYGWKEV
ncbi:DNA-3-methyladenine glycosylase [Jeotgalibaca sp. MA1X17-3]|uniref:DNA-3-methyladenine glycosylase n=1 Tax=Jeotgalibaca sp. MA1X17-3 TaxID=2908211 RepID=UPI001F020080|nr:DNA-3-methyladenine glycosylase [Jeotgalibaca sp. MA1X17-3]UJF14711.1 DNA-3-methyladenine glycosylase [Jeotgalibaca sp. MA1X17-3]